MITRTRCLSAFKRQNEQGDRMQMIRFRKILPLTLAGLLCVFLFTMPHVCTAGVKEGILLCGTTILPSLFPFMAISGFLLETGSGLLRGKWVTRITKRLFRLPSESASVILMAMIGGFPIGAKMTAQLLESRRITQNQAMRMCLFCINAGPAFVISAVGYSLFKSVRAGVILYSSMCLAALLCGMLCSFFDDGTPIPIEKTRAPSHDGTAASLVRAVHGATDAMLPGAGVYAGILCVDHFVHLHRRVRRSRPLTRERKAPAALRFGGHRRRKRGGIPSAPARYCGDPLLFGAVGSLPNYAIPASVRCKARPFLGLPWGLRSALVRCLRIASAHFPLRGHGICKQRRSCRHDLFGFDPLLCGADAHEHSFDFRG